MAVVAARSVNINTSLHLEGFLIRDRCYSYMVQGFIALLDSEVTITSERYIDFAISSFLGLKIGRAIFTSLKELDLDDYTDRIIFAHHVIYRYCNNESCFRHSR